MTKLVEIEQNTSNKKVIISTPTLYVHNNEINVPPPSLPKLYKDVEIGKLRLFKKARRKYVTGHIVNQLEQYEEQIPIEKRGAWSRKTSYQYSPNGTTNKYDETIYIKTPHERGKSKSYNLDNPEIGNKLRWKRIRQCHESWYFVIDRETGEVLYKPEHKCNDKLCTICSRIRSNKAVHKYIDRFKDMESPVMLVLHERNCTGDNLQNRMNKMYKDWRQILKQGSKRKQGLSGIASWEITYNEQTNTYHPHIHIICESNKAHTILEGWIKRDPEKRSRYAHTKKGNMQPIEQTEKSLMEVMKYTTNLSLFDKKVKRKLMPAEAMYTIAKATYKLRQWDAFGNWRKKQNDIEIITTKQPNEEQEIINEKEYSFMQLEYVWRWNGHDWIGDIYKAPLTDYEPDPFIKSFLGIDTS